MKQYVVKFAQGQGSDEIIAGTYFTITKEGVLTIYGAGGGMVAAFNPAFWSSITEQK